MWHMKIRMALVKTTDAVLMHPCCYQQYDGGSQCVQTRLVQLVSVVYR